MNRRTLLGAGLALSATGLLAACDTAANDNACSGLRRFRDEVFMLPF